MTKRGGTAADLREPGYGDVWDVASLGTVAEDILDRRGVTPLKLGSDFVPAGHRVISAKLIKAGRIDLDADTPRFVDEPTYRKWMRTPLLADDVVLTSEAPLGEVAYVGVTNDWVLGQRLFAIRTDKSLLHGRFLYYALRSDAVVHELQSRATGTTVQGIRQAELRRVRVPLPPLSEQRRIGGILGALDDKIELNRRMNETLEATARALFKSWFVDDGSSADADGAVLSDIADLTRETVDPRQSPDATFAHFSLPAFDAGCEPVRETGASIKSVKTLVAPGDVLLSKLNPAIERVWLPDVRPGDAAICSTEFLVLRPRAPFGRAYVYELVKSEPFRRAMEALVTGTSNSHQRAQAGAVLEIAVPAPDVQLAAAFEKVARPMLDRVAAGLRQVRTLRSMRDTLLPTLISGELRVPVAEVPGA